MLNAFSPDTYPGCRVDLKLADHEFRSDARLRSFESSRVGLHNFQYHAAKVALE
jgi:hypothetical protein